MQIEHHKNYFGLKNVCKIIIHGDLPPGSEGNYKVIEWKNKILNESKKEVSIDFVILDLSNFNYVFGDAIGSLWIHFFKEKIKTIIIAKNDTKKNLESLIKNSIPIEVVESEEEAILKWSNLQ